MVLVCWLFYQIVLVMLLYWWLLLGWLILVVGVLFIIWSFCQVLLKWNFALCTMPFLSGFYSKDFILEMFSMRYINMFVCLFVFVFIYWFNSLLLFSFVLFCFMWWFYGIWYDWFINYIYFWCSSLMWLTCPSRSIICLPYYLRFLTLLLVYLHTKFHFCAWVLFCQINHVHTQCAVLL